MSNSIFISSLQELDSWLSRNYESNESIWLQYYKPSLGLSDLNSKSITKKLLSYGWIDSLPRKVDEKRTSVRISKRNQKSNWSRVNKEFIKELISKDEMMPSGIEAVKLAKGNGTWDALNDVEDLVIPEDLMSKLEEKGKLNDWNNKSRSFKRGNLEILFNAKREDTRKRIIDKIISNI